MIDLNDVLRVVAEWDAPEGTVAQLVWHYLVTSGNNDDPQDVLDDIITSLNAAWANIEAYVSIDYLGSTIELFKYDMGNHQWDGVAADIMAAVDGGSGVDMVPHGAAGLVKMFTTAARRQARKYLFGIIETMTLNGNWTAAVVTALALFAADLDDQVAAPLTTLTFGTFNVDDTSPLYETFSPTNQVVQAEALPAYQRRRRPGTGI